MGRKKAIELLETIQKAYSSQAPRFKEEYLKEHLDEADEYARSIDPRFPSVQIHLDKIQNLDIPSRYQDSFAYIDIYEIFENIREASAYFDREPFKSKFINLHKDIPVFGTIPTHRFTALVTSANDDTDEVILVSEGLFEFANHICSCIAAFFPVYPDKPLTFKGLFISEEEIRKTIKETNLEHDFYNYIIHFINPNYGKIASNSTTYTMNMTEVLYSGFIHFCVAHEYCHFLLGHSRQTKIDSEIKGDAAQVINSFDKEYEADLFAAMLTETSLKKYRYPLSVFGIYICFRTMDIIERINKINNFEDNSHPSGLLRKTNLDGFLYRLDIDIFSSINTIFDCLLENFDNWIPSFISNFNNT